MSTPLIDPQCNSNGGGEHGHPLHPFMHAVGVGSAVILFAFGFVNLLNPNSWRALPGSRIPRDKVATEIGPLFEDSNLSWTPTEAKGWSINGWVEGSCGLRQQFRFRIDPGTDSITATGTGQNIPFIVHDQIANPDPVAQVNKLICGDYTTDSRRNRP